MNSTKNCLFCGLSILPNKKFCNSSCAAKHNNSLRTRTTLSKVKTSKALKKYYEENPIIKQTILKECCICNNSFVYKHDGRTTCSKDCSNAHRKLAGSKGGKTTSSLPFKTRSRSKNEKYFACLLSEHFSNLLTNKRMFGEYDADIIIEEQRIAIHWNGPFHYLPIFGEQHLKLICERDELRYRAIEQCGYVNYIIDDRDNKGFSKEKCEQEALNFLDWIKNGRRDGNRTHITRLI